MSDKMKDVLLIIFVAMFLVYFIYAVFSGWKIAGIQLENEANLRNENIQKICPSGNIVNGHTISYCDGYAFKCSEYKTYTNCFYIKGKMAEDTYQCGTPKAPRTCGEEIPLS